MDEGWMQLELMQAGGKLSRVLNLGGSGGEEAGKLKISKSLIFFFSTENIIILWACVSPTLCLALRRLEAHTSGGFQNALCLGTCEAIDCAPFV